jgi:DNA repair protein RadC
LSFNAWRSFDPARLYKAREKDLSSEELLARIFRNVEAARALAEVFSDLHDMSRASPERLSKVPGIGPARAEQFLACIELGKRLNCKRPSSKHVISSPEDVAELLSDMKDLEQEEFRVILLNTKNHVIRVFTVSVGTLNASLVHPREVLKPAISSCAASIILVHNHPSGDPSPSEEDIELTTRISQACELIGIILLDHVIIGDDRFYSLREEGTI